MFHNDSKKTGPKDVFLQLLVIITLYASAVNFGVLLFQYINKYFPDPLADMYAYSPGYYGPLRFALAALVVVFPVYVWLSWFLERELARVPEKRELRTRRWLLTFTLFAAALIIIGDLVTLVYRFLEGELTARFILKVLTVLAIAGTVFFYYLWNLRRDAHETPDPRMRVFSRVVVGVVVAFLLGGFFIAGSPQSERLRRFDERRVSDLQSIQYQLVYFWQQKERLPETLEELNDPISGYRAPTDPQDGSSYEYRKTGEFAFELCAVFKTAHKEGDRSSGGYYRMPQPAYPDKMAGAEFDTWAHDSGRTCFSRTIDPELYAPAVR